MPQRDANKTNAEGQTALMWAVAEKNAAAAKVLIEHGADVNAQTHKLPPPTMFQTIFSAPFPAGGMTAMLYAARQNDLESAKILVAAGANVKENAADGSSPLLVAVINEHYALAKYLLEHGADPNATDDKGTRAVVRGHRYAQSGMVHAAGAAGEGHAERFGFYQGTAGSRRGSECAADEEDSAARAAVLRWPLGQCDWSNAVLARGAIGRCYGDEAVEGSRGGPADRDQGSHNGAHGCGRRGMVRWAEPWIAGRCSRSAEALSRMGRRCERGER